MSEPAFVMLCERWLHSGYVFMVEEKRSRRYVWYEIGMRQRKKTLQKDLSPQGSMKPTLVNWLGVIIRTTTVLLLLSCCRYSSKRGCTPGGCMAWYWSPGDHSSRSWCSVVWWHVQAGVMRLEKKKKVSKHLLLWDTTCHSHLIWSHPSDTKHLLFNTKLQSKIKYVQPETCCSLLPVITIAW